MGLFHFRFLQEEKMKKILLLIICTLICSPTLWGQRKKSKKKVHKPVRTDLLIEHDTLSAPVTLADSIVYEASKHLGKPYRLGTKGPSVFDCSGFTGYVFKQLGFNLGWNSREQFQQGIKVSKEHIHKGDLIFFKGRDANGGVGHVGIVFDVNPKENTFRFIHASSSKGITIQRFPDSGYYTKRFVGLRRMVDVTSPAPLPIDNTFYSIVPPPASINVEEGQKIEQQIADSMHIVKPGETYGSIARKYNCTTGDIFRWNNLKKGAQLKAGQKLVLKHKEKEQKLAEMQENMDKAQREKDAIATNKHITVLEGENIYSISEKYHCTVKEIAIWNNLKSNELKVGQELTIRPIDVTAKKDTIENGEVIHTVAKGENLYQIARRYGCQPKEIKVWNNLSDNVLRQGEKLVIKRADKKGVHTVREGETLEFLAVKYSCTVDELIEWNHLTNKTIRPGRILKVKSDAKSIYWKDSTNASTNSHAIAQGDKEVISPTNAEQQSEVSQPDENESNECVYYTVKGGDTFNKIAKQYGCKTSDLLKWNNLNSYKLIPGKRLIVKPGKKSEEPVQASNNVQKPQVKEQKKVKEQPENLPQEQRNENGEIVYTVKEGDNLYNIGRRYKCSVKQLKDWNNLQTDKLRLKQKLIIKQ